MVAWVYLIFNNPKGWGVNHFWFQFPWVHRFLCLVGLEWNWIDPDFKLNPIRGSALSGHFAPVFHAGLCVLNSFRISLRDHFRSSNFFFVFLRGLRVLVVQNKPYFNFEKSNDVSKNLVVNFPDRKTSLSINARWKGIVVFIPSITNSLSARFIRVITSSRLCPLMMSLAIIES